MSSLPEFRLLKPATASEAVRLRASHPSSRYLAGGTDLLPNLRRGLAKTDVLIDLGGVVDLNRMQEQDGMLTIGAGVTLAALAAHPRIVECLPALAQAAGAVAGPTHRSVATLGGNLCLDTRCQYYNQSEDWRRANNFCLKLDGDTCRVAKKSKRCLAAFSGDVAPALMVLGATVDVLSPLGNRSLPIEALYAEDGKAWLNMAPDEMLAAVRVPLAPGWRSAYEKVRVRNAIEFPLSGVAIALQRQGNVLGGLRIACTGVASCPIAVGDIAPVLGKGLDEEALRVIEVQTELATRPMKTTLVDVAYRRGVTPILARRLVQKLWADAPWTA